MKTFHLELWDEKTPFIIDADRIRVTPTELLEFVRNTVKDEETGEILHPEESVLTVLKKSVKLIGTPDPETDYRLPNPVTLKAPYLGGHLSPIDQPDVGETDGDAGSS